MRLDICLILVDGCVLMSKDIANRNRETLTSPEILCQPSWYLSCVLDSLSFSIPDLKYCLKANGEKKLHNHGFWCWRNLGAYLPPGVGCISPREENSPLSPIQGYLLCFSLAFQHLQLAFSVLAESRIAIHMWVHNTWTHVNGYYLKTAVDPCFSLSGRNVQSNGAHFIQISPLWRSVQWKADSLSCFLSLTTLLFNAVSKFLNKTYCERVRHLASTSLMTHIRAGTIHNPPHHNSNCLQWLMFAKCHVETCQALQKYWLFTFYP